MSPLESQLIAALLGLWGVLVAVVGGALRYFQVEIKSRDASWQARLTAEEAQCSERITRLEAKLDESADTIRRQTESQQKQLDQQSLLISNQAQMIATLQTLAKDGVS